MEEERVESGLFLVTWDKKAGGLLRWNEKRKLRYYERAFNFILP